MCREGHLIVKKNKLVSALWWTNYAQETLFLNVFKHIFIIYVLQILAIIVSFIKIFDLASGENGS